MSRIHNGMIKIQMITLHVIKIKVYSGNLYEYTHADLSIQQALKLLIKDYTIIIHLKPYVQHIVEIR